MAVLYRHIRLDKNEPFYIGIGITEKRAFEKTNRNRHWKHIVAKTPYEVEILFDDLTWEQACEKEKEFIKLYGRRDLSTGYLVNLTDGGEGSNGLVMPLSAKLKISETQKGRKQSKETIQRRNETFKKIRCLPEYKQKLSLASKGRKISQETKNKLAEVGRNISPETRKKRSDAAKGIHLISTLNKKVYQYDKNGTLINEFISCRMAARLTNIDHRSINACCLNKRKSAGGFIWSYV